ncbi:hypothetical protein SAMN05660742_101243 [Propionispira arboris]|uniref:Uncharacterized protein n=1 Tax=Propionispira arboris TaxID=84035 RepID=A0A1H6UBI0_9FIRM|nr:hypothetical protein [Propionispira arboris]SEI85585.1 hypothetical protein SAMN05660742_101243 [Propionispira arboris]
MKKTIVLILGLLFCFGNYVFAANSDSSRLDGKPASFNPGHITGYFIWQDKDGLHLRTTTSNEKHEFTGTIHTDGVFKDIFESSKGTNNTFNLNKDHNTIDFKFITTGGSDAIDLNLHRATYIKFSLSMDSVNIEPTNVYIGKKGWHPDNYKFTISEDDNLMEMGDTDTVIVLGDSPFFGWWNFPEGSYGPGPYRHGHHW